MADIAVTAGQAWVDIDAFACIVAYVELLTLEDKQAEAVIPGILNSSIPAELRKLGSFIASPTNIIAAVVLVDISDPTHVSSFVRPELVREVYDHHLGFDNYWRERIEQNVHIEFIGACATLIWEEFVKRNFEIQITKNSATLLAAAIVSNTLNFNASMTSERDRQAFQELSKQADLSNDFVANYFHSCEATLFGDISSALKNDTMIVDFPNFGVPLVIGQCELWESRKFIRKNQETIQSALDMAPHWILTAPSISEGINHLYATNDQIKTWFTQAIGVTWDGDFGITDRLYLRKEIVPAHRKL